MNDVVALTRPFAAAATSATDKPRAQRGETTAATERLSRVLRLMRSEFADASRNQQAFGSETMTAVMAVYSVRIFGALVCQRFATCVDQQ